MTYNWRLGVVCVWICGLYVAGVGAAEPLPLEITPQADARVTAGSTFRLRIDTPGDAAKLRVQMAGSADSGITMQEKVGSPPLDFDITVPWEVTGPLEVGIVATNQDPATGVVKRTLTHHRLFSVPEPTEKPTELRMLSSRLMLDAPTAGVPNEAGVIRPLALYADGRRRSVHYGSFGTIYRSSDSGIAAVDGDGQVTAVSPGTAYVETDYLGIRELVQVSVTDPVTGRVPIVEYTDQVVLNTSGFRRDPDSGLYVQEVNFTNRTEWPIPQPIYLMMTDLTEGVEVKNSVGRTDKVEPLGSPVLDVDIPDGPSWLAPGATGMAVLRFRNWQNLPITYKLRLFGASPP